jgi:integrase
MALSDVKIRNTKPANKQIKLFDGDGLFLLVTPQAGKYFRLKYRFEGKEKLLALGTYPEISLADARQQRDEARRQVAHGIDPSEVRKALKAAKVAGRDNSFEVVAREWHGKFEKKWSTVHAATILDRLKKEIFPWLGNRPIDEIKAPELLKVLRRMESRGALDTAHRVRNHCSNVFRYAIATGRAERDPASDLRGALPPVQYKHMAAPTDPKLLAPLLRAIDGFEGSFVVKCAMQLAPILFVRPGELRHAEWAEIVFETAEWNIPSHKMKMKEPHLVPLPLQAVEILKTLHPLTGSSKYVFPCHRSPLRCMSENAVNAGLRRLGFEKSEITGHGFRAVARTILDEVLHVRPDYIEHQLGHAVKDPNGRAYNRTTHLAERRKMMQKWADYLDGLKAGAGVIPFRGKAV